MGWTMFQVWCSIVRSQKLGIRVRLPIDEHFRVRSMFAKIMSRVSSMSDGPNVGNFEKLGKELVYLVSSASCASF